MSTLLWFANHTNNLAFFGLNYTDVHITRWWEFTIPYVSLVSRMLDWTNLICLDVVCVTFFGVIWCYRNMNIGRYPKNLIWIGTNGFLELWNRSYLFSTFLEPILEPLKSFPIEGAWFFLFITSKWKKNYNE